jgi:hypothetical protein
MLGLVAAGRHVSLVPTLGWPGEMEGVVIRPTADGPVHRKIFTAVRRGTGERPDIVAGTAALAERARALGMPAPG